MAFQFVSAFPRQRQLEFLNNLQLLHSSQGKQVTDPDESCPYIYLNLLLYNIFGGIYESVYVTYCGIIYSTTQTYTHTQKAASVVQR